MTNRTLIPTGTALLATLALMIAPPAVQAGHHLGCARLERVSLKTERVPRFLKIN